MDRETVLHHLRAWADGVDPSTGLDAARPIIRGNGPIRCV